MKKTKTIINDCKCKVCGKDYSSEEVKRCFGTKIWQYNYCSPRCYTKQLTGI